MAVKATGLLIDAKNRTVKAVECETLEDWQRNVAGDKGKVYVEPIKYPWLPGHVVLVDEDGRVRNPVQYGFRLRGPSPARGSEEIIGNALIFATEKTDEGTEFVSATLSLANLEAMVEWTSGSDLSRGGK